MHTNKINNDRDVIIQSTQTTHFIQILCAAATATAAAAAADNTLTTVSGCMCVCACVVRMLKRKI